MKWEVKNRSRKLNIGELRQAINETCLFIRVSRRSIFFQRWFVQKLICKCFRIVSNSISIFSIEINKLVWHLLWLFLSPLLVRDNIRSMEPFLRVKQRSNGLLNKLTSFYQGTYRFWNYLLTLTRFIKRKENGRYLKVTQINNHSSLIQMVSVSVPSYMWYSSDLNPRLRFDRFIFD